MTPADNLTSDAHQAPLCGILILDKPTGISSMRAVADVRRRAGGAKTGHAGTLDPLAQGVLVLAIGRATKSLDRFMQTSKRYQTTIDLSAFTSTDDCEGAVEPVRVTTPPSREAIEEAVGHFRGQIMQSPPAFSAVKVGGRRAYQLARRDQPVDLPAREVTVYDLHVTNYDWPIVAITIHCGKGFYVRRLARDLGTALGTGGHCTSIRRTAVGPFDASQARSLDALPQRLAQTDLIALDDALAILQRETVDGGQ